MLELNPSVVAAPASRPFLKRLSATWVGLILVLASTKGIAKAESSATPDRNAAEYVLSIGGIIRVNGTVNDLKSVADIPKGELRLTSVVLRQNKKVNDAGLATLKGCKNLTHIDLWEANVTDVGIANLKECHQLTGLQLQGTGVTDAGLEQFKNCEQLTFLVLGDGPSKVTDKGLAHFKKCQKLATLSLQNIKITDEGLAQFKGYKTLTNLWLLGTQVTDKGLANFKDCQGLTELNIQNTRISDASLPYFKGWPNLAQLYVQKTKFTPAKIKDLAKQLPRCKIVYDGGMLN